LCHAHGRRVTCGTRPCAVTAFWLSTRPTGLAPAHADARADRRQGPTKKEGNGFCFEKVGEAVRRTLLLRYRFQILAVPSVGWQFAKQKCMGRGQAQPSLHLPTLPPMPVMQKLRKKNFTPATAARPKYRSAANLHRLHNYTILFFEAMHSASMGSVKRIEKIKPSEATESLTRPAGRRCHPGPSDQETK